MFLRKRVVKWQQQNCILWPTFGHWTESQGKYFPGYFLWGQSWAFPLKTCKNQYYLTFHLCAEHVLLKTKCIYIFLRQTKFIIFHQNKILRMVRCSSHPPLSFPHEKEIYPGFILESQWVKPIPQLSWCKAGHVETCIKTQATAEVDDALVHSLIHNQTVR